MARGLPALPPVSPAVPANCPECRSIVSEPDSEQELPNLLNPREDKELTAKVSAYSCGCGHKFTTVEYEPRPASGS